VLPLWDTGLEVNIIREDLVPKGIQKHKCPIRQLDRKGVDGVCVLNKKAQISLQNVSHQEENLNMKALLCEAIIGIKLCTKFGLQKRVGLITGGTDEIQVFFERFFEKFEEIQEHSQHDCVITFKTNAEWNQYRNRQLTEPERDAIQEYVSENICKKYIKKVSVPFLSIVFMLKKPNSTYRMCVDYRNLNALVTDRVQQYKVFLTLDLTNAYCNIRVSKDSVAHTAFTCEFGLFAFRVMPFGLKNAPSIFQRYMTHVIAETGLPNV
jgi:Reverse transcriptase (RNA-dependent DNA polymerase)